jgi:hypothetical protein
MRKLARVLAISFIAAMLYPTGVANAAQTVYECAGTSIIIDSDGDSENINQKSHTMKAVLDLDRKVRVFSNGQTTPLKVSGNVVSFSDWMEKRSEPSATSAPAIFSRTTKETTIDVRSGSYTVTSNTVEVVDGKKYTLDSKTNGSCKAAPVAQ